MFQNRENAKNSIVIKIWALIIANKIPQETTFIDWVNKTKYACVLFKVNPNVPIKMMKLWQLKY